MEMKGFLCFVFVGILLSKLDVESLELVSGNVSYLDANPPPGALMVPLTLIQGADAKGAVCLDGTLPGYYFHPGFGSGANNWLVNLEGGGWCENVRTCVYRKTTRRGSSKFFDKQILFSGILSNKAEENPDFFNWNKVKIRYCDGASFAGDGENKAAGLYFRGQRIWQAAMDELMSKGMRNAKQSLLSGCSAGGLATILHCDEFRDLFPKTSIVKCFSDAGLFMDIKDVSGGHTMRDFFAGVVGLQGVERNLPRTCTNHLDPTSCFFPQNFIANIKTPIFFLNSAYDSWQVRQSLAPSKADPQGKWKKCRMDLGQCSPPQIQDLQGLRNEMLNAIKGISAESGFFINSCLLHCQSEMQPKWFAPISPSIGGKGIAKSVGDWYFDRAKVKAIDCAYPCRTAC